MQYLYAFFFGSISSFAFSPFTIWLMAFVGLAGWYSLLIKSVFKQRIAYSYLFGLGLLLPSQYWTGIYVGNIPWLILCFGQAFLFLTPAFFVGKRKKNNQQFFIVTYVITELLLRTIPFSGFGWTRLGFTQIDSPLRFVYPLGGVALVALILSWISSARSINGLLISFLIPALSWMLPPAVDLKESTKIALVQGGVDTLGLDFNAKPKEVFYRHLNQTKSTVYKNQVELVIWPENSVDVDINTNPDLNSLLELLSKELQTPVLIGAVTKSVSGPRNQSIIYNPLKQQVYTKRYLTPFGEYLPVRNIAEKISKFANDIVDFVPGDQSIIFKTFTSEFTTLICYELINDSYVAENFKDFIVIQTNNATFGDSYQLDQQLNIARVRATETSRYIAYVSTTGTTSFIDFNGKIISKLDKFMPGTLIDEIQIVEGTTYAQRYAKYVEFFAMLLALGLILVRARGRV